MQKLPSDLLWIGHAGDGRDARRLLAEGIEAVVQLAAEEPPLALPRELTVCRIPLVDGAENASANLRLAVGVVQLLIASETPTLVCCSAGLSRSPAIVAAALARRRGTSPGACLAGLAGQHPLDVSPAFWQQLEESLRD
jgi:hypothetical protein